ncbi:MAG: hypothetical protein ACTSX8_04545, partial [Alphaproteobacteria bacterium]
RPRDAGEHLMSRVPMGRVPSGTDHVWPLLGAQLAKVVRPGGSLTSDIVGERSSCIDLSATMRTNALAWLENNGYIRYNPNNKNWRLTSSGRRLAQGAA